MALYDRKCRNCGKWHVAGLDASCPWCKTAYGTRIEFGMDSIRDFEAGDVLVNPKTAGRKGDKPITVGSEAPKGGTLPGPGEFGYVAPSPKRGQS